MISHFKHLSFLINVDQLAVDYNELAIFIEKLKPAASVSVPWSCGTVSKFVVGIVRNYRQSKAQLQEEPKQPKTPQEEYDLIAEKDGTARG